MCTTAASNNEAPRGAGSTTGDSGHRHGHRHKEQEHTAEHIAGRGPDYATTHLPVQHDGARLADEEEVDEGAVEAEVQLLLATPLVEHLVVVVEEHLARRPRRRALRRDVEGDAPIGRDANHVILLRPRADPKADLPARAGEHRAKRR